MDIFDTSKMSISELIDHLGTLKNAGNEVYKTYKDFKQKEEEAKVQLKAMLEEAGMKSAKTDTYLASIGTRSDMEITNEQDVISWIKHEPNIEDDAYIGLKVTNAKILARDWFKKTGEIITGTEPVTKESISIRSNK